MKIITLFLGLFFLAPVAFSQQQQLSAQEQQTIKDANTIMAQQAKQNKSLVKGQKLTCYQECIAEIDCGKRPETPPLSLSYEENLPSLTWATCVVAQMAGCKAGCGNK